MKEESFYSRARMAGIRRGTFTEPMAQPARRTRWVTAPPSIMAREASRWWRSTRSDTRSRTSMMRRFNWFNPLTRWACHDYSYDQSGNRTGIVDAAGHAVVAGYDANLRSVTNIIDPLGRQVAFQYDTQGKLLTTIFPDGSREQYLYNSSGAVTSKVDRAGHTTEFLYDSKGLLTSKRLSDGRIHTLEYDTSARLSAVDDNQGWRVEYAYNDLDQMTQCVYRAQGTTRAFSYWYNPGAA